MSRTNGHCSHGHVSTPIPVETYLPETELEFYRAQPGYPSTGYLVDVAVGCKLCDGAVTGVVYKPGPPQELPVPQESSSGQAKVQDKPV